VDGKATVDGTLCRTCEACIDACPMDAIVYEGQTAGAQAVPAQVPAVRPVPEVMQVGTQPLPLRTKVLPVIGAALAWAGREIVPRLAEYALDSLERWADEERVDGTLRQAPNRGARGERDGSGGRRHRRRRRGG
jgi:ferredoxin